MKTTLTKPGNHAKWHVVDADGKVLGRLASQIAQILRGKHKPIYTANVDTGDFVIVLNAAKVRLTGKKETKKEYMFFTGWVGRERYRNVAHFRQHPQQRRRAHAQAQHQMIAPADIRLQRRIDGLALDAGDQHVNRPPGDG